MFKRLVKKQYTVSPMVWALRLTNRTHQTRCRPNGK